MYRVDFDALPPDPEVEPPDWLVWVFLGAVCAGSMLVMYLCTVLALELVP